MKYDEQFDRELPEENVDYEMVPGEEENWCIRIMTGNFVETVFAFGELKVSGEDDEPMMSFNFDIISTPDPDLEPEDTALQLVVGDVLSAVLVNSIKDESVATRESK